MMKNTLFGTRGIKAVALAAALLTAAVQGGCTDTPGATCEESGGIENPDGTCVAKCSKDSCKAGNVCVDNVCALICDAHSDCYPGTQTCQSAIDDETDEDVLVCRGNDRLPPQKPGGIGALCTFGQSDCQQAACPSGLECDPTGPADCKLNEAACADKDNCNIGITEAGEACTFNTCPANECKTMFCVTEGEGDAEAYCTTLDCSSDSECGAGFYCGVQRDARDICGNTCSAGECSHDAAISCSKDGDCQKGNNGLCGQSLEPCLDPANFGADGGTYQEGALCLLRNVCLRRERCAPCESSLDCDARAPFCVESGGKKICAGKCDTDANCLLDQVCSPSADGNVCVPRNGVCDASGASGGSTFCHHCNDDADCGGADGTFVCGEFGGQRACYDARFTAQCNDDSDCPQAPSGAFGTCLDEGEGVQASSSVYKRCYIPFSAKVEAFTCWPPQ